MILPFMDKFPDGIPTDFQNLIEKNIKKHTMRVDPNNRWITGRKIHYVYHNRTKQMKVWKHGICLATQKVEMFYNPIIPAPAIKVLNLLVKIDGKPLGFTDIQLLIQNDGLTYERFIEHFFENEPGEKWEGKLIHWTNLRYK
jgi:hypothetical protein